MKKPCCTARACLAVALFALALPAGDPPVGPNRDTDAYCLQVSILSPGFSWGDRGPGALDMLDVASFLAPPEKAEKILYRRSVCPVDIGLLGLARARSTHGLAVNVFANAATNLGRDGYQTEGVVPERGACYSFSGLQLAGLSNLYEDLAGIQVAGGSCSAVYGRGLQGAGLVNTSFEFQGVQIAGLLNFTETFHGVQLGLFNVAADGCCLQVGLGNVYTGAAKGLQIGLVNANVQHGYLPVFNLAY